MNKKIIVAGSLNFDSSIYVEAIPKIGATIFSQDVTTTAGGKGGNQSVQIGKMGGDVTFIGRIGKDAEGQFIKQSLKKYSVKTHCITEDETAKTGSAVCVIADDGNNMIIVNRGANASCCEADVEKNLAEIESARIVLLQLETSEEMINHIMKVASEKGKTVVLNPAPATKINEELFPLIDFFIPNETECEFYTGINLKVCTEAKLKEAGEILLAKGVKNVIITLGDKGSFYMNKKENLIVKPIKVNAVDTTAAGDSFIGALVVKLAEDATIEEALRFANAAGAFTTTKNGAQEAIGTLEEIQSLLDNKAHD